MFCKTASILLLFVFFFVSGRHRSRQPFTYRVIAGEQSNEDTPKLDFIVALRVDFNISKAVHKKIICTGTVIKPAWTLTAAHCIELYNQYKKIIVEPVHFYVIHRSKKSTRWCKTEVIACRKRPNYHVSFAHDDLGLVKHLDITLPSYGKLSALDYKSLMGSRGLAYGFGITNSTGEPYRGDVFDLEKNQPQVIEGVMGRCPVYYPMDEAAKNLLDNKEVMCLYFRCYGPGSMCLGDSGGPLIHSSGVVAVATVTDDRLCHTDNNQIPNAGMFTMISPAASWIHNYVKE